MHRLLTRTPISLVHGVMVVTTGFGSVSLGSIPGGPTKIERVSSSDEREARFLFILFGPE